MGTISKSHLQDMPPPGGYCPLQWQRIRLKTVFGYKLTIGLWLASTVIGWTVYGYTRKKIEKERIEMRSALFALTPMLVAERDRAFLNQCRINQETERELMKNDPEWELGTYYREPVYITTDKVVEPPLTEFMAHGDHWELAYRILHRHFF